MTVPLPPLTPPRPNAGQGIDWDRPVGYGHAANVLEILKKTLDNPPRQDLESY